MKSNSLQLVQVHVCSTCSKIQLKHGHHRRSQTGLKARLKPPKYDAKHHASTPTCTAENRPGLRGRLGPFPWCAAVWSPRLTSNPNDSLRFMADINSPSADITAPVPNPPPPMPAEAADEEASLPLASLSSTASSVASSSRLALCRNIITNTFAR